MRISLEAKKVRDPFPAQTRAGSTRVRSLIHEDVRKIVTRSLAERHCLSTGSITPAISGAVLALAHPISAHHLLRREGPFLARARAKVVKTKSLGIDLKSFRNTCRPQKNVVGRLQ